MLKALTGLLIAGAAAIAFASPAAAAPSCNDGTGYIIAGPFANNLLEYYFKSSDFCDGAYDITAINWVYGQNYVWFNGEDGSVDGVYISSETATVTVTDGTYTDTFDILVVPCFTYDADHDGQPDVLADCHY